MVEIENRFLILRESEKMKYYILQALKIRRIEIGNVRKKREREREREGEKYKEREREAECEKNMIEKLRLMRRIDEKK